MSRLAIEQMSWLEFVDRIDLVREAIAVGIITKECAVELGARKLDKFLDQQAW